MKALLVMLAPLQACSQQSNQVAMSSISTNTPTVALTPEDALLVHRFRDIKGGELSIDATADLCNTIIYRLNGDVFPGGGSSCHTPKGNMKLSFFGDERHGEKFSVPKAVRMMRYPDSATFNPGWDYNNFNVLPRWQGAPLVDVTVPVASRIPEEAADRVRKYKGSLTLKLRLTPETILVGWQISLGGTKYPFKKNEYGFEYANDEDLMIGGDFCERQVRNVIINGKWELIEKKGWYIDKKTGQKIQTEF